MAILSAKFISEDTIEVEESVTKFVPDDISNRDRQALAAWEAEGNEITPLPATKPSPPDQQ